MKDFDAKKCIFMRWSNQMLASYKSNNVTVRLAIQLLYIVTILLLIHTVMHLHLHLSSHSPRSCPLSVRPRPPRARSTCGQK